MGAEDCDIVSRNLEAVRDRIRRSCERCGRSDDSVQLIAVTKYAPVSAIQILYEQGIRDFGESRPQAIWDRRPQLPSDSNWHLIGHWQTNKVRRTVPMIATVHSIDRWSLAEIVSTECERIGRVLPALIEVKLTADSEKHGFLTEEIQEIYPRLVDLRGLAIGGLMGMGPLVEDPEDCRNAFRSLRVLRDELRRRYPSGGKLNVLSMGMSHDFEVAIEEGATHVRIGSSLFEGLEAAAR